MDNIELGERLQALKQAGGFTTHKEVTEMFMETAKMIGNELRSIRKEIADIRKREGIANG